jgi:hypothetical protein
MSDPTNQLVLLTAPWPVWELYKRVVAAAVLGMVVGRAKREPDREPLARTERSTAVRNMDIAQVRRKV